MVKQNDVIAIIIIVLFFVLALISFGIYRLVQAARTHMSVTSTTESSSSGSGTGTSSTSISDH
jgi:thiol:disulfide interchange protein